MEATDAKGISTGGYSCEKEKTSTELFTPNGSAPRDSRLLCRIQLANCGRDIVGTRTPRRLL